MTVELMGKFVRVLQNLVLSLPRACIHIVFPTGFLITRYQICRLPFVVHRQWSVNYGNGKQNALVYESNPLPETRSGERTRGPVRPVGR